MGVVSALVMGLQLRGPTVSGCACLNFALGLDLYGNGFVVYSCESGWWHEGIAGGVGWDCCLCGLFSFRLLVFFRGVWGVVRGGFAD